MAQNVRVMTCRPEAVFEVLANGWFYPSWVVGASRMRRVEADWPQPDGRLHHSFGIWPFLIDDTTSSVDWDPPKLAVMRARGWPIGEATVRLEVRARDEGCIVRITEHPSRGPATLLPRFLIDPLLRWRNAETLRRLAYLAEGHAGERFSR